MLSIDKSIHRPVYSRYEKSIEEIIERSERLASRENVEAD